MRGARAQAVGCLGDARAAPVEPRIDALLVALRDPSTWVRGNAAGALREIGQAAVRALPELRHSALALAAEGDEIAASMARDAILRLEAIGKDAPDGADAELDEPVRPRASTPPPR